MPWDREGKFLSYFLLLQEPCVLNSPFSFHLYSLVCKWHASKWNVADFLQTCSEHCYCELGMYAAQQTLNPYVCNMFAIFALCCLWDELQFQWEACQAKIFWSEPSPFVRIILCMPLREKSGAVFLPAEHWNRFPDRKKKMQTRSEIHYLGMLLNALNCTLTFSVILCCRFGVFTSKNKFAQNWANVWSGSYVVKLKWNKRWPVTYLIVMAKLRVSQHRHVTHIHTCKAREVSLFHFINAVSLRIVALVPFQMNHMQWFKNITWIVNAVLYNRVTIQITLMLSRCNFFVNGKWHPYSI